MPTAANPKSMHKNRAGTISGIQPYPLTQNEFDILFKNEDFCWAYMERLRWPDGFICPKCGGKKEWQTDRGEIHCGVCHRETTVIAGTILHRTRLPLRTWIMAAWIVMRRRKKLNARLLQKELGVKNYETAWAMLQRLRKAIGKLDADWLRGTVAVYKTHINTAVGQTQSKSLVLMAIEDRGHKVGRIRLRHVPSCSGRNVRDFVRGSVKKGSTILTVKGFRYWASNWKDYTYSNIGKRNQWVQHVEASLKSWLNTTHNRKVAPSDLQSSLDEYAFHHNRNFVRNAGKLFRDLLRKLVDYPA